MDKAKSLERLHTLGLVAVIRGPSVDGTLRLVEALVKGGVTGIEITFTTPNALEVTNKLRAAFGDAILLGMGTLVEPAQAQQALDAGATFLVSPHTEAELARAMTATGLPTMLGALTPTEVMLAKRLGSDVIKLFPGSLTGPAYVKALKGPFPDLLIMPTGGVSAENVKEWFAAGVYAVGAGSELCPPQLIKEGRFDELQARAERFAQAVRAARS
ncbi:MAG: bifunctional 4-hydroxy-2-oxoglutarate aldolase/2-dehydro-3-deoxy-phosphogluconate aldolase [Chloroflexi bacterium]|nr:bifunctional 4-hydroxy-2-oxoglutarate aldolase/2-dehydro-3-deoxy-phosphogluconate aldolase [Chloroflexota bacterium]